MADPDEEILTVNELREILAEVEGTTPESIQAQADELEIEHPSEADVIEQ